MFRLDGFAALLAAVRADGYRLVGPTVRDGAIVYGDVHSIDDLPAGWTADQAGGRYRLRKRQDGALFGYAVGPHSLKQLLFVPRLQLVQLRRDAGSFARVDQPADPPRIAVLGARACDLAAMDVQDRVFYDGPQVDPDYMARRGRLFVIAVQCGEPGGTCFCASMKTGPRAERGFDLALTELLEGEHRFVVEVGTEAGASMLERAAPAPAAPDDVRAAESIVEGVAARMGRTLDTDGIKELFYRNLEHPRWDDVADRCLGCANCTLVCPTCFCSTVEDTTDLAGETAERWRRWDSCFTLEHSYVHGGSTRASTRSRYRQWLTHKLASWIDQFGTSGCVGCGRCITWCPVGIDITEEAAAIRAADGAAARSDEGCA
ncbi:MAG: 4Fe-4S dicluster domain-containing protein [Minicystis sp.]